MSRKARGRKRRRRHLPPLQWHDSRPGWPGRMGHRNCYTRSMIPMRDLRAVCTRCPWRGDQRDFAQHRCKDWDFRR